GAAGGATGGDPVRALPATVGGGPVRLAGQRGGVPAVRGPRVPGPHGVADGPRPNHVLRVLPRVQSLPRVSVHRSGVGGRAEPGAAADRGRTFAFCGSWLPVRPRRLSCAVRG